MPITALSEGVVRALGSSQVLPSPELLVKELVENAIDAQARTVSVEISPDTLDCIQVRDNGLGIAPEDRDNVAKRYFTSKIRNLAELQALGGRSLGFRGEALASAAEVVSGLEIITRIEGEAVACRMVVGKQGFILSRNAVSHPIGTTIRATQFLHYLPVRREATLKKAAEILLRIRRMLQLYALTRPLVRFSLRVPKAKNQKHNWTYVPKPDATLSTVALSILGNAAAAQCSTYSSGEGLPPPNEAGEFHIEAFLPKPDADPSQIVNKGYFIAVDSRPVSCAKGVLKEILSLYKLYVRSTLGRNAPIRVKAPFIYMNIICSAGTYDANIEPAKDDVLFACPNKLIGHIENFLSGIYGSIQKTDGRLREVNHSNGPLGADVLRELSTSDSNRRQAISNFSNTKEGLPSSPDNPALAPEAEHGLQEDNDDGLVHGSHPQPIPEQTVYRPVGSADEDELSPSHRTWRSTMYGDEDFTENLQNENPLPPPNSMDETQTADEEMGQSLNPWVLAKINAAVRPSPAKPNLPPFRTPVHNRTSTRQVLPHSPAALNDSVATEHTTVFPSSILPLTPRSLRFPPSSSPHLHSSPTTASMQEMNRHSSPNRINAEADTSSSAYCNREGVTAAQKLQLPTLFRNIFVDASDAPLSLGRESQLSMTDYPTPTQSPERTLHTLFKGPLDSRKKSNRRLEGAVSSTASATQTGRTWFEQWSGRSKDQLSNICGVAAGDSSIFEEDSQPTKNNTAGKTSLPGSSVRHQLRHFQRGARPGRQAGPVTQQTLDGTWSPSRATVLGHDQEETRDHAKFFKSSHKDLYNATLAAFRDDDQRVKDGAAASPMPESDPRRFLMRLVQKGNKDELQRIRLSLLPLETVPEGLQLHGVISNLSTDLSHVADEFKRATFTDIYVRGGRDHEAPSSDDLKTEQRTKELLRVLYRQENGQLPDIPLNLARKWQDLPLP